MTLECSREPVASDIRPIQVDGRRLLLLDQRKLPEAIEHFDATSLDAMCYAIKEMVVRGAPAIGVAAALGLASEALRLAAHASSPAAFLDGLWQAKQELQATRPTAVNLRWGTDEIFELAGRNITQPLDTLSDMLFARAKQMVEEDIAVNKAIGEHGAGLIAEGSAVLTHCNAGALATCGWGTALGVIRSAADRGTRFTVFADETRPRQQGARLTVWELMRDNIPCTLITDSMAGFIMSQGKIGLVLVGADRIAANGDTANKIGTYTLAVLAKAHGIPFYVAAPLSTIDKKIRSGKYIPIEERHADEVTIIGGAAICPPGTEVLNPAFDVTPARLITGIITEAGILRAPYREAIKACQSGRG